MGFLFWQLTEDKCWHQWKGRLISDVHLAAWEDQNKNGTTGDNKTKMVKCMVVMSRHAWCGCLFLMIPYTQPKSLHTMQVLNVQALLPLSYTLHPPRPSVVTEWVLSVFGWAHWKRMCHSSASSFISTPGQSLGQHTLMLSHKTCWMYIHAAEFQCSL